jgi:hypothetical protein
VAVNLPLGLGEGTGGGVAVRGRQRLGAGGGSSSGRRGQEVGAEGAFGMGVWQEVAMDSLKYRQGLS